MPSLHGHEYGQGRNDRTPVKLFSQRLWRDTKSARALMVDRQKDLDALLGIRDSEQLSRSRLDWIEAALQSEVKIREGRWSENVAVDSLSFVEQVKADLGAWG
jgi:hypothetical protein